MGNANMTHRPLAGFNPTNQIAKKTTAESSNNSMSNLRCATFSVTCGSLVGSTKLTNSKHPARITPKGRGGRLAPGIASATCAPSIKIKTTAKNALPLRAAAAARRISVVTTGNGSVASSANTSAESLSRSGREAKTLMCSQGTEPISLGAVFDEAFFAQGLWDLAQPLRT